MIVDLEFYKRQTLITFKLKDFTTIDDVISIGCAMANRFCFEAGSLLSPEFEKFIKNMKLRNTYAIVVGIDEQDRPTVTWGVLDRSRTHLSH